MIAVLCAGEVMWDLHAPPGESLEEATTLTRVPGGAASNVARALVAAGIEAGVADVVSADAVGRGFRDALARGGVDVSALVLQPGRTGLVFIDGDGDRFVSYRPDRGDHPPLLLLNHFAGVLHVAALEPARDRLEALAELAARAKRNRATVTLDVNARPRAFRAAAVGPALRVLVGLADVVKVSEDDLRVLAIDDDDVRGALNVAPAATLVITRGAGTISADGPWGTASLHPQAVASARKVGAGDAFCAALISALLRSSERDPPFWRHALAQAHAAAAAHVSRQAP